MKDLKANTPVGYGGSFRTQRPTRLAIIPLGYHDGMLRGLANRGVALIRGRRAPVVGQVSMDYTTLDITEIPGVSIGDPVTLIGADGHDRLTVEDVAERAGTIPYEVLCRIGRRVVRVPKNSASVLPRS
jgi:alanine racemase